jgi:hypothetical protein
MHFGAGHAFFWQGSVFFNGPEQIFPPPDGKVLMLRTCVFWPGPQSTEHSDQAPHGFSSQSTLGELSHIAGILSPIAGLHGSMIFKERLVHGFP